jgi:type II secretory pathway component PulF
VRYFAVRADSLEALLGSMIYPIALAHLAVLLPNLSTLLLGSTTDYLRIVLPPIAIGWATVIIAGQVYGALWRSPSARAKIDAFLLSLPVVGGIVRTVEMADYAHALSILYAAGTPIGEALERAAEVTSNFAFREGARRVASRVRMGDPLATALATEPVLFTRLFVESVRIAEASGKIDEALDRAATTARDQADRAIRRAAKVAGGVIYFCAVAYVAYIVISFWAGYAKSLDDAMNIK